LLSTTFVLLGCDLGCCFLSLLLCGPPRLGRLPDLSPGGCPPLAVLPASALVAGLECPRLIPTAAPSPCDQPSRPGWQPRPLSTMEPRQNIVRPCAVLVPSMALSEWVVSRLFIDPLGVNDVHHVIEQYCCMAASSVPSGLQRLCPALAVQPWRPLWRPAQGGGPLPRCRRLFYRAPLTGHGCRAARSNSAPQKE
jgi:hypothetical protein